MSAHDDSSRGTGLCGRWLGDRADIDAPRSVVDPSGRWRIACDGRPVGLDELLGRLQAGEPLDDALRRLRGVFAMAIVDTRRGRAHLVRDQLGGRDVYYSGQPDGSVVFAGEIAALLPLMPRTPGPDHGSVSTFLSAGTVPEGRSLYEGVSRLPPGCRLDLGAGTPTDRRWWSLVGPMHTSDPRDPGQAAWSEASAAVERALAHTRRSPAVLVSGGLDSSTVLSAVAQHSRSMGRPAPTAYSATFPDHDEVDEAPFIDELVRFVGVPSVRFPVMGGDAFSAALRYLQAWKQPIAWPNHFIWEHVYAQIALDGHIVVIDGQGGDELFDMQPWHLADLVAHGHLAAAWALTGAVPGFGPRPSRRVRLRILRYFARRGLTPQVLHGLARALGRAHGQDREFLTAQALCDVDRADDPWRWKHGSGPLARRALTDALTRQREVVDAHGTLRRSLAMFGLQSRHPFLHDVELAEWALSVPQERLFHRTLTRPLLRAGLEGHVPESIRLRPNKSYFNAIARKALLDDGSAGAMAALLTPGRPEVGAWVSPRWLADHASGGTIREDITSPDLLRLYRAASVEAWLRTLGGSP